MYLLLLCDFSASQYSWHLKTYFLPLLISHFGPKSPLFQIHIFSLCLLIFIPMESYEEKHHLFALVLPPILHGWRELPSCQSTNFINQSIIQSRPGWFYNYKPYFLLCPLSSIFSLASSIQNPRYLQGTCDVQYKENEHVIFHCAQKEQVHLSGFPC